SVRTLPSTPSSRATSRSLSSPPRTACCTSSNGILTRSRCTWVTPSTTRALPAPPRFPSSAWQPGTLRTAKKPSPCSAKKAPAPSWNPSAQSRELWSACTPRKGKVERITRETQIRAELNLDGKGRYEISTGIRFFDHMLELFAKHGGFDLTI